MEWLTYDVLRVIWWALLGVLLIGFAVMDGFDLGVGTLLPFVARTDIERRVMINSIGPTWEGNQVWFILGGGAIFAAFPLLYAAAFSGFYFAMLLILVALILRPVGFDFRNKLKHERWRAFWDYALFIGGFVPALVSGVAFGNLFLGVPFHFNDELRFFYEGSFWLLFRPFAVLCGLVSVAMLVTQGAAFLVLKTAGVVQNRARSVLPMAAIATLLLFIAAGIALPFVDGYAITSAHVANAASDPTLKTVAMVKGHWLQNYVQYPLFMLAPALAGVALIAAALLRKQAGLAFIASSAGVAAIITTAGLSLFPFFLPSIAQPNHSLTLWDAASSQLTLKIMLVAAIVFMPIIIAYTSWVFRVLRGPVTAQTIEQNPHSYY
jgi:cytochrome d ubiquinol oxidase subunit II